MNTSTSIVYSDSCVGASNLNYIPVVLLNDALGQILIVLLDIIEIHLQRAAIGRHQFLNRRQIFQFTIFTESVDIIQRSGRDM